MNIFATQQSQNLWHEKKMMLGNSKHSKFAWTFGELQSLGLFSVQKQTNYPNCIFQEQLKCCEIDMVVSKLTIAFRLRSEQNSSWNKPAEIKRRSYSFNLKSNAFTVWYNAFDVFNSLNDCCLRWKKHCWICVKILLSNNLHWWIWRFLFQLCRIHLPLCIS